MKEKLPFLFLTIVSIITLSACTTLVTSSTASSSSLITTSPTTSVEPVKKGNLIEELAQAIKDAFN